MTLSLLHFTPCGLIIDACGVVLLAFSFFLKSPEAMIEESGTTWNSTAYVAIAEGKADGISGTTLLFLGFIYQALGYANITSEIAVQFSFSILALFLIVYFSFLRKWLVNSSVKKIEDVFKERERSNK